MSWKIITSFAFLGIVFLFFLMFLVMGLVLSLENLVLLCSMGIGVYVLLAVILAISFIIQWIDTKI